MLNHRFRIGLVVAILFLSLAGGGCSENRDARSWAVVGGILRFFANIGCDSGIDWGASEWVSEDKTGCPESGPKIATEVAAGHTGRCVRLPGIP
jgi:hypothetical protein